MHCKHLRVHANPEWLWIHALQGGRGSYVRNVILSTQHVGGIWPLCFHIVVCHSLQLLAALPKNCFHALHSHQHCVNVLSCSAR